MANKTEPTATDQEKARQMLSRYNKYAIKDVVYGDDAINLMSMIAAALAEARDQYRLSVMLEYTKREALAFEAGHQAALRSRPATACGGPKQPSAEPPSVSKRLVLPSDKEAEKQCQMGFTSIALLDRDPYWRGFLTCYKWFACEVKKLNGIE